MSISPLGWIGERARSMLPYWDRAGESVRFIMARLGWLDESDSLIARVRREFASAFAYAGVLTFFVNIAMLFVPLYSMILYDRVLQSKSMDTLTMLSIVCVFGMAMFAALEFSRSMVFMLISDRLSRHLSIPTLRAAIAKSLSGDSSAAGQAMRDLDSLRNFASSSAPVVFLDILWTPAMVLVLYLLNPWYGHYGLLCAGILFVLSVANDLTTREPLVAANATASASLGELSAALRQRELIDGLGMLPDLARHWVRKQNRLLAGAAAVARTSARFSVAAKTARLTMQAGVIAVGAVLVVQHEASPGSLLGAALLMGRMLAPFEQLISAWRQWTAALSSWQRIDSLAGGAPDRIAANAPAMIEGRLVLDHVGFAPASAPTPIIEDVSLTIEPGEAVALVGPSGSGKSTLARLIMGILPPTSGGIYLDGVATGDWDRTELARHVGYLPQAVGILDGTILDNIARMQSAEPAIAIEAARRAGVHELIGRLPDGYATQVGDAGQALSGGTRQRIALARALYGQPKLVVLDEPNSNLDHDGEQTLVRVINEIKRGGAGVLLITHRPAILAAVDRIVTIEKGRVARIDSRAPLSAPGLTIAQTANAG